MSPAEGFATLLTPEAVEARRYAAILEASRNELYLFEADTLRFITANKAARDNLGYSLEALRAMTPLDLKPDYDDTSFRRMIAPLARGEISELGFETEHRRRDGSHYPVEVVLRYSPDGARPLFVATILDISDRREKEARLQTLAERLRALSEQLVQVQEHERRHLARELHDEIGQQLTAALIRIRDPAARMPATLRTDLDRRFNSLIDQVRQLSLDLRPAVLDDLGLGPALRGYAERQAQLGHLQLTLAIDVPPQRFTPEVETALFRIAQEATTNVLRHAAAQRLRVRLWCDDGCLFLDIEDDGRGFELPAESGVAERHFGLMGMHERARLLGGDVELHRPADGGTRVRAWVPVATGSAAP
jgi:PAS domain S-box-containing protein